MIFHYMCRLQASVEAAFLAEESCKQHYDSVQQVSKKVSEYYVYFNTCVCIMFFLNETFYISLLYCILISPILITFIVAVLCIVIETMLIDIIVI